MSLCALFTSQQTLPRYPMPPQLVSSLWLFYRRSDSHDSDTISLNEVILDNVDTAPTNRSTSSHKVSALIFAQCRCPSFWPHSSYPRSLVHQIEDFCTQDKFSRLSNILIFPPPYYNPAQICILTSVALCAAHHVDLFCRLRPVEQEKETSDRHTRSMLQIHSNHQPVKGISRYNKIRIL